MNDYTILTYGYIGVAIMIIVLVYFVIKAHKKAKIEKDKLFKDYKLNAYGFKEDINHKEHILSGDGIR